MLTPAAAVGPPIAAPAMIKGDPFAWSFPNRDSAFFWCGQLKMALPAQEFWLFDMRALPMEFL